jgi:hypothetical protein
MAENETRTDFMVAMALVVYLLILGVIAAVSIAINFPTQMGDTWTFGQNGQWSLLRFVRTANAEQGFIMLAFLAGLAGSFLHGAQSLATYLGNEQFKRSWATWYFLRPWIGGVLGFTIYFAFRAGLVSSTSGLNPFGVVALGALGGWFSKTTTDKLQEVFETLFRTRQDDNRKDKLVSGTKETVELKVERKTEGEAA